MSSRAARRGGPRQASPSGLFLLLQKKNKMDIFASFATDEKLENEGKWFPLSKTAKVLVARSGNPAYVAMLRKAMAEAQLDLTVGEEADQLAEGILIDVMAKTILLKWEGLEYQGAPAAVTAEMAKTFLKIKDFRKKISALSENFDAFRVKSEAEQKNG